ncbi:putative transcription factor interactor and regulator CCHC(Zn) family [Helianthus anomalus]
MNFVTKGTYKFDTFENKSNIDYVNRVKILKIDAQNNSGPSTLKSQSSSTRHHHDTSVFVERRSCFDCGKLGNIIRNCPYVHTLKAKADVSREQKYQKRSISPKQDPRIVKECEKKQKRKQSKVI